MDELHFFADLCQKLLGRLVVVLEVNLVFGGDLSHLFEENFVQ